MNTQAKVFLACAFGAAIGTLVSLQLSPLFWWAGTLVGGLVGYPSYEAREIVRAAPVAWRYATDRPQGYWLDVGKRIAGYALFLTWVPLAILLWFVNIPYLREVDGKSAIELYGLLGALGVAGLFGFTLLFSMGTVIFGMAALAAEARGNGKEVLEAGLELNPFTVCIALGHFAVVALLEKRFYLPALWRGMANVFHFFWHLFRLIHSDLRLLCGLDAAIGAGIGYAFGNVLIGALAGGLIGLVNYELVSRRLLKLVPNEAPWSGR